MRKRRGGPGPRRWQIGVDLGGTWVRIVALDGRGGHRAVKLSSPGLTGLPALLSDLRKRWGLGPGEVDALVVASRGVWTIAERRRQERRLHTLARKTRVISDVEAAYLGALGERAGILLLAGTGSMALGRDALGRWARAGGWGPLLGDEGSAFWIGREWLRATMGSTGFAQARRILAAPNPVARIAALAPRVLRRARGESRAARRIVVGSQDALAELVVRISRDLRLGTPVLVSWAGRLLEDPRFRAGVWRAARRAGVPVNPQRPRERPATAVGRMAQDLAHARRSPTARRGPPY
ncbi:MAG TPA: BadF/BadG/BcrA/BcrD ATPase family protein [Candidatus Methylomirabilis sp.]|nr:BadF/BadG/BcrA/BcrD ATPase family protein [Candidatus Methylomirabilis sp.]